MKDGLDKNIKIEQKIQEDFLNAMLGISIIPEEYPRSYFSNYLKAAYDQGKAMELNENLTLKYCCTVLQKVINDNQREKLDQALNNQKFIKD